MQGETAGEQYAMMICYEYAGEQADRVAMMERKGEKREVEGTRNFFKACAIMLRTVC